MKVKKLFKEYYKYCIVGVFITAFDFCMLIFQVEILHIYYLIATCISYIIAALLHYILSAKFVFKDSDRAQDVKAFLYFALLGLIGLALYEFLMYLFVEFGHLYYILAKVAATAFTFTFNFATRKYLLFK